MYFSKRHVLCILHKPEFVYIYSLNIVANNDFASARVEWFPDGKLNASYNCIDRHLETKRDQTAFIWEGDDPDMAQKITYG